MTFFPKQLTFLSLMLMVPAVAMSIAITSPVRAKTTDQMTCSQAIATYEKNRRINVRSRHGQVLPIYGGVPASKKGQLTCGRGRVRSGYMVKTIDKKRCAVMYTCG